MLVNTRLQRTVGTCRFVVEIDGDCAIVGVSSDDPGPHFAELPSRCLLSATIDKDGTAKTPTFPFPDIPPATGFFTSAVTRGANGFQTVTDAIKITSR